MKTKLLALSLVLGLLLSSNSMAKESKNPSNVVLTPLSQLSESEYNMINGHTDHNMKTSLTNLSIRSAATSVFKDQYEDNNTIETAYPYEKCTKMTGDTFREHYISANIHDEEDLDIYTINLVAGEEYFFHLKNLVKDYDLAVVTPDISGAYTDVRTGSEEEFFYIKPEQSGKFYVVVFGKGQPYTSLNYFLYAGKSVMTKTLNEDAGLSIKFNGAGLSNYYVYDLTNKIRPNSWVKRFEIDYSGSGYWIGFTKYLKSESGSVYTNKGFHLMDIPEYSERADQKWQIAGRVHQGNSYFLWQPRVSIEYSYIMKP